MVRLGNLLKDVQKLKTKYGLSIETTSEEIGDVLYDNDLTRLRVSTPRETEKWRVATVKAFGNRTQPWRRLRWLTYDEKHCRSLLSDINYFTTELQHFLETGKREALQNKHNTLLRHTIVNTTSQLALDLISHQSYSSSAAEAVGATAQLKKKRLWLGLVGRFRRSSSGSSREHPGGVENTSCPFNSTFDSSDTIQMAKTRLSARQLTLLNIPRPSEFRQLAYYQGDPVLLEWRSVLPTTWTKIQDRVEKLSTFLHYLNEPSFHSLSCRGYVRNHDAGRYGFVFDLPCSTQTIRGGGLPALPTMRTLRATLDQSQRTPSLNLRISYAIVVLETLLQIHTAGWLHKELRSDNIIFLDENSDVPLSIFKPASSMYIVGYVYARADNPHELTEPAREDLDAQLYRHPQSLGSERSMYRKVYDIFSVGCILLELGLWSSMSHVLAEFVTTISSSSTTTKTIAERQRTPTPQDPAPLSKHRQTGDEVRNSTKTAGAMSSRTLLLNDLQANHYTSGTIVDLLEARVGKQYARIVSQCLGAGHMADAANADSGLLEDEYALQLEEHSLKTLKELAEKL